jgi:very-short-patch-repair endonuclease
MEYLGIHRGVVRGGKISTVKGDLARQFRRNMTPAERALWEMLRARRLDGLKFRRQQAAQGFIVDFYCNAYMLAVEADGEVHRDRMEEDRKRDAVLGEKGVSVLRFENGQILQTPDAVRESIRKWIRENESKKRRFYERLEGIAAQRGSSRSGGSRTTASSSPLLIRRGAGGEE